MNQVLLILALMACLILLRAWFTRTHRRYHDAASPSPWLRRMERLRCHLSHENFLEDQ